ncbi:hypothetical protein HY490_03165 [Candidatus Woesearchaeota archaeon]|nr:hypothetical protein [Candidatus Woesearchaeota archaeon]
MKDDTIPLFSNNTKAVLGVMSVVLVLASLVVSQQPPRSLLGQIPLARDVRPMPTQISDSFVLRHIDIGDPIGRDQPTLSEAHFKSLRSADLQTNEGKTRVQQFLILSKPGDFQGSTLFFGRDNDGRIGHFLKFESNEPMFEYVMAFSAGLRSALQDTILADFIEVYLPFFGRPFVVVDAQYNQNTKVLRLKMLGPVGSLQLEDTLGDQKYNRGVMLNGNRLDAEVRMQGQFANNRLSLSEIRYRPKAQGHDSGDIFVPPRNGLKTRLKHPGSLLSNSFDIVYGGLRSEAGLAFAGDTLAFTGKGRDYDLTFVNNLGQAYKIPLVTTDPQFKYGDDDQDLVFKEGNNQADFNIDRGDIFLLTSRQDIVGTTTVLKYRTVTYDQGRIVFDDLAGGDRTVNFDATTGQGTLVSAGTAYAIVVSPTAPHPIVVDQNGDGGIDGDEARIVLKSGQILDIGDSNVIGGNQINLRLTTPARFFDEPTGDESINFVITKNADGPTIEFPDPGALTVKRSDRIDRGLSRFGVSMTRDGKRTPAQVVFSFPTSAGRVAFSDGTVLVTLEREKYLKKKPA